MELFDSHLHLDDAAFDLDREAVLERARAAGVVGMVTAGTDLASSARALALAAQAEEIYAAVAIHPHEAHRVTASDVDALRRMAEDPRVVAVGETGLDLVRGAPREAQEDAFRAHVRLARERGLPVVIHCREAYPRVLEILEEEGAGTVIMHAFSGSVDTAAACTRRRYFISLAGPVTFRNAGTVLDVARAIPLELLLLETDAPVLSPEPLRGRRNEPSHLPHIARRVAALRGMAADEVAAAATGNARRAFRVEGA
ncbi:MAG TPA: TatD family hydrolase [bacterium]|nr:TatD family hydrolase [bacterium]